MLPDPKDEVDADVESDAEADEGPDDAESTEIDGDGGDDGESAEDSADELSGSAEDDEEVDAEPAGKQGKSSASDVIRANKKARKEADRKATEAASKAEEALRRAEAAERRAEEAERAANARRQAESAEAEAARVELMSESERLNHYRAKDNERHTAEMNGVKFQIWDSTDRSDFRQLVREDPLVAKVKDKVEAEYEKLRAQGRPVSREILANQEIAKMVRSGRASAGTAQRKRAAEGVQREKVRPQRTRSDVASDRSRRGQEDTAAARKKRLEDVQL